MYVGTGDPWYPGGESVSFFFLFFNFFKTFFCFTFVFQGGLVVVASTQKLPRVVRGAFMKTGGCVLTLACIYRRAPPLGSAFAARREEVRCGCLPDVYVVDPSWLRTDPLPPQAPRVNWLEWMIAACVGRAMFLRYNWYCSIFFRVGVICAL